MATRSARDSAARRWAALSAPRDLAFFDEAAGAWAPFPPGDYALWAAAAADDLRANAAYAGGLWVHSDVVKWLWETLAGWAAADRAKLLAFVTAAQRPPPNGFKYLNPPFTVVHLSPPPGTRADDMLPCASTCFNQLKLPAYTSKQALAKKLRVAIESGTGFELT